MIDVEKLYGDPQTNPELMAESAALDIASDVENAMERNGLNRADLAKIIDSSRSYVTKVLTGDANFTLKTLAKLASALNCQLNVSITPTEMAKQQHKDYLEPWAFYGKFTVDLDDSYSRWIKEISRYEVVEKIEAEATNRVSKKSRGTVVRLAQWKRGGDDSEQSAA